MIKTCSLPPFLAAALLVLLTSACAGLSMTGDGEDASLRALTTSEAADSQASWAALYDAQRQAPGDPRTLLAAARYHEKAGRLLLARQYYQAVLLHRRPVAMPSVAEGKRERSPEALARMALERLDGRAITPLRVVAEKPEVARAEVAAMPLVEKPRLPAPTPSSSPPPSYDAMEDDPVIERFRVFTRWMGAGLVTPDEFAVRRYPNLGALLPYAERPPALDLYGSPPEAEEMEARLRQGIRGKARADLLNSLIPANPRARTSASDRTPAALDEALTRLDALARVGLVTSAEREREITAIGRLQSKPTIIPASIQPASGGDGVHLISLDNADRAATSWRVLVDAHQELANLGYRVARAGVGTRITHRIIAGPVADPPELCRRLRARGQYCLPMRMP